ncbi:MAG: hypothetical protein ACOVK9_05395 [Bacteroidia bacterium]
MRNKLIFIALLFIGSATFFTGCTKEDPKPTTGGLKILPQLKNSTGYLKGVQVGLATSKSNLDNSIYLQDKVSNSSGVADFGQLNPGNYYYDCFTLVGGNEYYGEGQVQVSAGTDLELTLILE